MNMLSRVDDGIVLFSNRDDPIDSSKIVSTIIEKGGLTSHVGRGDNQSKIKLIFFLQ